MQNDVSSHKKTGVDDKRRTVTIPILPESVLQTTITMDDPRWNAFMLKEEEKQMCVYAALDGCVLGGQRGRTE